MRLETELLDGHLALALRAVTDDPDVTWRFHVPLTPGSEGREIEEAMLLLRPTNGVATEAAKEHLLSHKDRIGVGGCHFCTLVGRVTRRVFTATPAAAPRFAVIPPGVTALALERAEADKADRAKRREAAKPILGRPGRPGLTGDQLADLF